MAFFSKYIYLFSAELSDSSNSEKKYGLFFKILGSFFLFSLYVYIPKAQNPKFHKLKSQNPKNLKSHNPQTRAPLYPYVS